MGNYQTNLKIDQYFAEPLVDNPNPKPIEIIVHVDAPDPPVERVRRDRLPHHLVQLVAVPRCPRLVIGTHLIRSHEVAPRPVVAVRVPGARTLIQAGGIVDVHQKRALRSTILKPAMM